MVVSHSFSCLHGLLVIFLWKPRRHCSLVLYHYGHFHSIFPHFHAFCRLSLHSLIIYTHAWNLPHTHVFLFCNNYYAMMSRRTYVHHTAHSMPHILYNTYMSPTDVLDNGTIACTRSYMYISLHPASFGVLSRSALRTQARWWESAKNWHSCTWPSFGVPSALQLGYSHASIQPSFLSSTMSHITSTASTRASHYNSTEWLSACAPM